MERTTRNADTYSVNKQFPIPGITRLSLLTLLIIIFPHTSGDAWYVHYKEQYYKLYHLHYIQYPDDTMENIYWLEKALQADFCNPLYALALIENEIEYEKYRYLFTMHINLKMVEQYLLLGSKWDKRVAYFYNEPWKEQNLESLKTAEQCYETAKYYWQEAVLWSERANAPTFRWINLQRVQFWEDEAWRISENSLNYGRTIERELLRLYEVRKRFLEM